MVSRSAWLSENPALGPRLAVYRAFRSPCRVVPVALLLSSVPCWLCCHSRALGIAESSLAVELVLLMGLAACLCVSREEGASLIRSPLPVPVHRLLPGHTGHLLLYPGAPPGRLMKQIACALHLVQKLVTGSRALVDDLGFRLFHGDWDSTGKCCGVCSGSRCEGHRRAASCPSVSGVQDAH